MLDENNGSYFNAIVRDALNQLQKVGSAIVFSYEQANTVKEKMPSVEYHEDDGFYYLKNTAFDFDSLKKKNKNKKKDLDEDDEEFDFE